MALPVSRPVLTPELRSPYHSWSVPLRNRHAGRAHVLLDPYGVLGPNEMFFASSQQLQNSDGLKVNHLSGHVLVRPCPDRFRCQWMLNVVQLLRNPVRLATDIQMVRSLTCFRPDIALTHDVAHGRVPS